MRIIKVKPKFVKIKTSTCSYNLFTYKDYNFQKWFENNNEIDLLFLFNYSKKYHNVINGHTRNHKVYLICG